jgi:hypothetical protein
VFRRSTYRAVDLSTGRPHWTFDAPRDASGVAGMTSRSFYLAGGCPLTRAD